MHRMMLVTADFRKVLKMVIAKPKNAGVAESRGAPPVRENTQVEILSPAPEMEKWNDIFEKLEGA